MTPGVKVIVASVMFLTAGSARGEGQPELFDLGNGGTVRVRGSALTVMREGRKTFETTLPPYFDARHTPKKVPLSSGNGEMWVWAGGTPHAWCVRFAVFISTEAGRVNGMVHVDESGAVPKVSLVGEVASSARNDAAAFVCRLSCEDDAVLKEISRVIGASVPCKESE